MRGCKGLTWLLEDDNPSARYRALRTLLDRPSDSPDLRRAQAEIATWGPARRILEAQWPDGYWMRPGRGYSPRHKATVWQVIFLAELGTPLDDALARACRHVLDHSRLPDGRFSAHNTTRGTLPCLNGSLLRALLHLGYQDSRLEEGLQAAAVAVQREGFYCRRRVVEQAPAAMDGPLPCAWGAIRVLGALAEVPAASRTTAMRSAIEAGVRLLKEGNPLAHLGFCALEPRRSALAFGFPLGLTSDLLEALEVLARLDAAPEPWIQLGLGLIHEKQDARGRWQLEYTPPNMWASFGRVGRANKWVTWRALHVQLLWQGHDAAATDA